MHETVHINQYPHPRLKRPSVPVTAFDAELVDLTARMFELMREAKGVGLAAPQVGVNLRVFVTNHTGEPADDRVYVNPELSEADGAAEDEEGCLSLPKINVQVVRSTTVRMVARDVAGNPIEQTATDYVARIWQHETDHLNGIMLTDRMGPVAKLTNRKQLRALEEKYAEAHPPAKPVKRPGGRGVGR
jgi:peptide deformylase